jgi:hypothetical protein
MGTRRAVPLAERSHQVFLSIDAGMMMSATAI